MNRRKGYDPEDHAEREGVPVEDVGDAARDWTPVDPAEDTYDKAAAPEPTPGLLRDWWAATGNILDVRAAYFEGDVEGDALARAWEDLRVAWERIPEPAMTSPEPTSDEEVQSRPRVTPDQPPSAPSPPASRNRPNERPCRPPPRGRDMSGVRHSGGEVDVQSGTGFSSTKDKITPIVQLTVAPTDATPAMIHLLPQEARAIGLDLIAAASQSLGDSLLRRLARERGEDGDALVLRLRQTTKEWLGEG